MYKQPSETNDFFLCGVYLEESFELKIPSFGILMKYQPIFCFALLAQLSVMMTADNRNLIIPRGVRPDYLFLIVSLKKKELHSRANAALSLLLSDTQLKKIQSFLYTEID